MKYALHLPAQAVCGIIGRLTCLAILIAAPLGTGSARASVNQQLADFEGTFSPSFPNVVEGSLSLSSEHPYTGTGSAKATYNGSGNNGYARAILDNIGWIDGDEVWVGAAYYLPSGFINAVDYCSILRSDNYTLYQSAADASGIALYGSDNLFHFDLERYDGSKTNPNVVPPFSLPEGSPFWLEIHMKLSQYAGSALTEVYVDGQPVSSSTAANTYGREWVKVRAGIVAIKPSAQVGKPFELYFDRFRVGPTELGPVGGTSNVPPSVRITGPTDGSTVTGRRLTITADASDDNAVSRVEFAIDGSRIATDYAAPYATSIRTRHLANGQHLIEATAYDAEGLSASDSITVTK